MKDIKFKYFHFESKEMSPQSWTPTELMEAGIRTGFALYPEDGVWIQYTGLKDKNGVEIYHKDVLKDYTTNTIWVVNWCEELGAWSNSTSLKESKYSLYKSLEKEFEVIGNAYENPELLGGSND